MENRPETGTGYNVAVPFVTGDFNIRDFKAEDFDTLWLLDQECFGPGIAYSREELKTYIRQRGAFTLIATKTATDIATKPATKTAADAGSGSIAGFIVTHAMVTKQGSAGHIITIDVVTEARRSGVGSLLLRAAEDRLRKAGSGAVGLETAVDNLSALSFYKKHGYNVIGTRPRYYANGLDALVLTKQLSGLS